MTLQDRLTKELRLENISDLESANQFLEKKYRKAHNKRFEKIAKNDQKAFVASLLSVEELTYILSEQVKRKVSKNLELSFQPTFR